MMNYKKLIRAGVIGLLLSTTPNLYAQNVETKPSSNEKKELGSDDLEQLVKGLAEINALFIRAGQDVLRYTVSLATTEDNIKIPEFFEEIFKRLGVPYFKKLEGTVDQKYDSYLKQFEQTVVQDYGRFTKQTIETINSVLFEYFSEKDKKEYEKAFGIKPGESRTIYFKFE